MTKPIRFYFVTAPSGARVKHRAYLTTFTEGSLTECGIAIPAGWIYGSPARTIKLPVCKRCQRVAGKGSL